MHMRLFLIVATASLAIDPAFTACSAGVVVEEVGNSLPPIEPGSEPGTCSFPGRDRPTRQRIDNRQVVISDRLSMFSA